jgi:thioredoxin-like negative regulator of GroEL
MHAVAQQYAAAAGAQQSDAAAGPHVSFGVMDVDAVAAEEGGAVSSKLGLQQLPTYIVYKDGQEVARLSSSPDRRRLAEVLAQQVAAVADADAGGSQQ